MKTTLKIIDLILLIICFLELGLVLNKPVDAPYKPTGKFAWITPDQVIATEIDPMVLLLNEQREKYGVEDLTQGDVLNKSAKAKACDMRDRNYFAHTNPDGKDFWQTAEAENFRYSMVGENLAEGFSNDYQRVKAWMGSTTHRENILEPKFKDVGVGRCGIYVVTHFGEK